VFRRYFRRDFAKRPAQDRCGRKGVQRVHEIMAITGHQSLEEVERYTKAARKAKLADKAMERLKE